MAAPRAIAPALRKTVSIGTPEFRRSVDLLSLAGAALALAGFFDLVLAWVPLGIGNPEWEFGTVTGMLNGLPLPTVGLVLVLISARERGRIVLARIIGSVFAILAVATILAGVLYALDVPLALRAVQDPLAKSGLIKAIIKAMGLVVVYSVVFFWIAVGTWRRSFAR